MESKRLVEIFEKMKENLINGENYLQHGLCGEIVSLYIEKEITSNEKDFVKMYLFSNKPTLNNIYSEFYKNQYWINDAYWWRPISVFYKTKEIRIDYLTKLIANIK